MIEVTQLTKTYPGGVEAVRGIDFEVQPGEAFGLLGPNGAGKSTTIGMLTTTIAPTSGTARVAGIDVAVDPLRTRRVSGVVFQDPVVDRSLSGRDNLEIHAKLWGLPRARVRTAVEAGAEAFGLKELIDRPVDSYSGGQRRRLEIARALVSEPAVLFLDEPTVGLDPRIRQELMDLIAGLRDSAGLTILLTTHYLDEAERLCDRVAIMHSGRIVGMDSPAALLDGLGREILDVRVAGDGAAGLARLQAHGVAGDDAFRVGSTLTIPVHQGTAHDAVAAVSATGLATTSVTARRPSLDDVYLRLTGDSLAA
jgi:ABC-2 type transport system ATP-binding protein